MCLLTALAVSSPVIVDGEATDRAGRRELAPVSAEATRWRRGGSVAFWHRVAATTGIRPLHRDRRPAEKPDNQTNETPRPTTSPGRFFKGESPRYTYASRDPELLGKLVYRSDPTAWPG